VNSLGTMFPEIEEKLCKKYGLRDAVVGVESEAGESLYRLLALAASEWLIPRLSPETTIGLSFGRTISYLPLVFHPPHKIPCTFTEVIGGLSNSMAGYPPTNIIAKMAELCGGRAEFLNVPTVVSSPEMREMLMREKAVSEAFQKARACHFLLTSIGDVSRSAPLYQQGFLSDADLQELWSRGAVGDVMGHFINTNGKSVPCPLDERLMNLGLREIIQIPLRILIAGGEEKAIPIRAAIQSGLFNVLIIDWKTAQSLQMD
jgi:DNA-binding transcriptional regulator LsrR (DeoR family)